MRVEVRGSQPRPTPGGSPRCHPTPWGGITTAQLFGIDPRGTGQSTNITCGNQSGLGSELDARDRSRANIDLILNANKLIAQYCQTRSGELGKYITTEQTAPAPAAAAKIKAYRAQLTQTPMPMAPVSYADAFPATFISVTCNDTPWLGNRQSLIRLSDQLGRKYPLIGWSWIAQPCISWNRPNVRLPQPTGAGLPNVLMVQSTHDPATPIEGAQRAHRAFANSRLLTVNGEGDHGIYAATGNKCVDDIVETFIVDGKAPQRDLSCPGMPLPAPAIQTEKTGVAKAMQFEKLARR